MVGRLEPSVDLLKGLIQTAGGAEGSVGGIAQAGRIAAGLRQSRRGWLTVDFRGGVGVLAMAALAMAGLPVYARLR